MRSNLENIDVFNFLPHRPPMLMVTKFLSLSQEQVTSSFFIDESCVFLDSFGNFTESGLIENSAQTCSSIVGQNFFKEDDIEGKGTNLVGFISAIKKAKIFTLPKVQDTLITKATLISKFDTGEFILCTMQSSTFNNEELIVDCSMNLIIQEI